ncbi:MAG: extracellular solute-binding protein [Myxacorys chilensis ATA2-1-KO14]|jgi:phosphate transport system substrate-binding protein|nr:extracellular solute-binding protein [Myxacorys chilensis ATA2-1-KO14]
MAQAPAEAQATAFKLPGSVPKGTNVRIDGSSSMVAVNRVLEQRFEKQYPGTKVTAASAGAPQGLQALVNGKVDLAAIGRPLTAAEKAKGLAAVQIGRDKIAIVVSPNNPFTKSLNSSQFAKMFRGEIKNWSEVGGPSAPVQFIDRPASSDTRQAFQNYPVFKQGKFETGSTAKKLNVDTTAALVKQLGKTGIGYTTSNQLKNQSGAKALPMQGIAPSDPRYPFSQPLYYVYNAAKPSPAAQAFLGFATAPASQTAIAQAGVADPVSASAGAVKAGTGVAGTSASPAGDQSTYNAAKPSKANGSGSGGGLFGFLPSFGGDGTANAGRADGLNWWWLFPIASGAGLLWLLGKSRRSGSRTGGYGSNEFQEETPGQGFTPPETDRSTEQLGAGRVDNIQEDRAARQWGREPSQAGSLQADSSQASFVETPDQTIESDDLIGDPIVEMGDPIVDSANSAPLNSAGFAGGVAAGTGAAAWSASGNRNMAGRGGESRVVLKARSPQEIEAYWDIAPEQMQSLRQQGGNNLAIRLYDVTDIDLDTQSPHSVQQFDCDELTHRQRLAIATPDRDYLAELGSLNASSQWISIARSAHVHVPASSTFLGRTAQTGGATVAGGTTLAGGAVNSDRPFLAGDRDSAIGQPDFQNWTTEEQSAQRATPKESPQDGSGNVFEGLKQKAPDVAEDTTQTENAALTGGAAAATGAAAAWSFLSGKNVERTSRLERETLEREPTRNASAPPNGSEVDSSDRTIDRYDSSAVGTNVSHQAGMSTALEGRTVPEGRIVLTARNAQWAYAYWDVPRSQRAAVNRVDQNLVLRLYDVTDINLEEQAPERFQQFDVDDLALSCDLPIPQSNRTYMVELGYASGREYWAVLARSTPVRISDQ